MNKIYIALSYVQRGISIIPLQPNDKKPHARLLPNRVDEQGKVVINPQTGKPSKSWRQFQKRFATESEIRRWFITDPNAGIGLVTGALSGCIALDIDGIYGEEIVAERGGVPHETPQNRTARGRHILLAHPNFEVHNFQHALPELDMRGDGGYIAVWPTVHPSGHKYSWIIGLDVPFAPMPNWLIEMVKPVMTTPTALPVRIAPRGGASTFGSVALDREVKNLISARESNRNNQLNRSAFCLGQLVGGNELTESDVIGALKDAALAIGLTEREIMPTIQSGLNAGKIYPRTRFGRTVKHV